MIGNHAFKEILGSLESLQCLFLAPFVNHHIRNEGGWLPILLLHGKPNQTIALFRGIRLFALAPRRHECSNEIRFDAHFAPPVVVLLLPLPKGLFGLGRIESRPGFDERHVRSSHGLLGGIGLGKLHQAVKNGLNLGRRFERPLFGPTDHDNIEKVTLDFEVWNVSAFFHLQHVLEYGFRPFGGIWITGLGPRIQDQGKEGRRRHQEMTILVALLVVVQIQCVQVFQQCLDLVPVSPVRKNVHDSTVGILVGHEFVSPSRVIERFELVQQR